MKLNLRTEKILLPGRLFVLALLMNVFGGCYIENACWKAEANEAFQKYGSFKKRSDILRLAGIEKDPGSNPVEVIERDPNGCSLGSNGRTVLRFYFDKRNNLTKIQAFQEYIVSDPNYHMKMIEERRF